jgi:hypothetical protein
LGQRRCGLARDCLSGLHILYASDLRPSKAGLPLVFKVSEMGIRLAGCHSSAILFDHALLLHGLGAERSDTRPLCLDIGFRRGDFALRLLDSHAKIPGIDSREHVTSPSPLIICDGHRDDVARDARSNRHHIRSYISVVGFDHKSAGRPPARTEYTDGKERRATTACHELATARLQTKER